MSIELFTARTPNGHKVSIALEELELPYTVRKIDLKGLEQKQEWFLKLNPNGRIPAIIDHGANDETVFESGAILIYLAEKTGRLLPTSGPGRSETLGWLMLQMSGVGPMIAQFNIFNRYFPEKIPAVLSRYQNESRRLLEVLDRRLGEREWLTGEYSIADIANWGWIRLYEHLQINVDGLENLLRWHRQMAARPACQRGVAVPEGPKESEADSVAQGRTMMVR